MKRNQLSDWVSANLRFEQVINLLCIGINSQRDIEETKMQIDKLEACIMPYMIDMKNKTIYRKMFAKEERRLRDYLKKDEQDYEKKLQLQYDYYMKKYQAILYIAYKLKFLPQRELKMKKIGE